MNTEKITLSCAIDNWANSDVGLVVIDYPDPQPVANSYIIAPGDRVSLPVVERINQFWASAANGGVQDDKPSVGNVDGRGYMATGSGGLGITNKWIDDTEVWTAEVIWTDIDIAGGIVGGNHITLTPTRSEGGLLIVDVESTMPHGNVVIGVKKAGDSDYLWSWHLWITGFNPEVGKATLPSGAVAMDRNLGAINSTAGDNGSMGLLYQWGRKDPLGVGLSAHGSSTVKSVYESDGSEITSGKISSGQNLGTLALSIQDPLMFYTTSGAGGWNRGTVLSGSNGYNLWGGTSSHSTVDPTNDGGEKTIYDPCPFGWRVGVNRAGVSVFGGLDALNFPVVAGRAMGRVYTPVVGAPFVMPVTYFVASIDGRLPAFGMSEEMSAYFTGVVDGDVLAWWSGSTSVSGVISVGDFSVRGMGVRPVEE